METPHVITSVRGHVILVDPEFSEYLSQFRWRINTDNGRPYRMAYVGNKSIRVWMAREIYEMHYGPNQGSAIRYLNKDPLDNRLSNLALLRKPSGEKSNRARAKYVEIDGKLVNAVHLNIARAAIGLSCREAADRFHYSPPYIFRCCYELRKAIGGGMRTKKELDEYLMSLGVSFEEATDLVEQMTVLSEQHEYLLRDAIVTVLSPEQQRALVEAFYHLKRYVNGEGYALELGVDKKHD